MQGIIERRLVELGITLPQPMKLPPGVVLPFRWIRVVGRRAILSGHLPTTEDGSLWPRAGKVGAEVSVEEATAAARQVGLCMLGTLSRELGSLDRISNWVRVLGMVNTAPGFHMTAPVINGFSDLLIEVFGPEVGAHARSAVGFAEIPFGLPVEIEAEVEISA